MCFMTGNHTSIYLQLKQILPLPSIVLSSVALARVKRGGTGWLTYTGRDPLEEFILSQKGAKVQNGAIVVIFSKKSTIL